MTARIPKLDCNRRRDKESRGCIRLSDAAWGKLEFAYIDRQQFAVRVDVQLVGIQLSFFQERNTQMEVGKQRKI